MPAFLISLSGHPDIALAAVLTVVGRHQGCDARVSSSRVSRRHCCLALDRAEVIVRDLSSTNGTWINGRRVEDGSLRPGDELAIAHLRYRLEIGGDPEEAASSAPAHSGSAPNPAGLLPDSGTPLPETIPETRLLDGRSGAVPRLGLDRA